MAKLAYDTGRGSQSRVWYSPNKGEIQTLNITINHTKQGCPKMPLRGLGVQACNIAGTVHDDRYMCSYGNVHYWGDQWEGVETGWS